MRVIPYVALCVGCWIASCGTGIQPDSVLVGPSRIASGGVVVSGRTGESLGSAKVQILPDGRLIQAFGFLSLMTSRSDRAILWPVDDLVRKEYTASVVYSSGMLARLGAQVRRVGIRLDSSVRSAGVGELVARVARTLNTAQKAVEFVVDDYTTDFSIALSFNEYDPMFLSDESIIGVARVRSSSGGTIQSVSIVVPSSKPKGHASWLEPVLLHEFGHALGMGHSPVGVVGVMSATQSLMIAFTDAEKLELFMMYSRMPGTLLRGDTEYEGVQVQGSSEPHDVVITCH